MSSFVLVHGAWSDSSAWTEVAALLREVGHDVSTPDLPAHGSDSTSVQDATLSGYADVVSAAAEALPSPVVLVGHSMAGTVISTVAERRPDLVGRLVYVAAFLLPDGQSLYGFTQTSPGMSDSDLGPALRPGDGVLGVDPDQFVGVFCADASDDKAASARTALRPDPLAPLGTPVSVSADRWGSVPRAYVHTAQDRCVSLTSQQEMIDAVGVDDVRTVDGAHLVMLSRPTELVSAVLELAGSDRLTGSRG